MRRKSPAASGRTTIGFAQVEMPQPGPCLDDGATDAGPPLSLEPKRTLSANCPKEFFRCLRNAKRAEFRPQDRIGDRKMIASEHIEMLICYVYIARSLFEEVNSARSGRSRWMPGLDVVVF